MNILEGSIVKNAKDLVDNKSKLTSDGQAWVVPFPMGMPKQFEVCGLGVFENTANNNAHIRLQITDGQSTNFTLGNFEVAKAYFDGQGKGIRVNLRPQSREEYIAGIESAKAQEADKATFDALSPERQRKIRSRGLLKPESYKSDRAIAVFMGMDVEQQKPQKPLRGAKQAEPVKATS